MRFLDCAGLYWHYPHYHAEKPSASILKGDWKLIEWFETGKAKLLDLAKDPSEERDVAGVESDKKAELLAEPKAWQQKVRAQMMKENPDYDVAREGEGAA